MADDPGNDAVPIGVRTGPRGSGVVELGSGNRSRASFSEARLVAFECLKGGAEGDRTPDLCIANAALSQLSYRPNRDAESSFCAVSVNRKTARGVGLGTVSGRLFCDLAPLDPG